MPYRYVALLRSKAGEATALQNLARAQKARILPLVQISQRPPPTFAQRTAQAWAGLPLALDGMFNFGTTGSLSDFTGIFNTLGNGGVTIIPGIEYPTPPQYAAGVGRMIGHYAPGLLVRERLNKGSWQG